MYEYSNLTPEQREEVVLIRKSRGYPLHAPPHPFRGEGYYLITAANFMHRPIMHSCKRRSEFEIELIEKFRQISEDIRGWVILPNHYHLIAGVVDLNLVSQQLKLLHGQTSYLWNKEDNMSKQRKVWYHFSDRLIRNERHFFAALNYIHHNPVKHDCCKHADEWLWSSLHLYLQDYGKEWVINNWHKYKPGEKFGKGWDDL